MLPKAHFLYLLGLLLSLAPPAAADEPLFAAPAEDYESELLNAGTPSTIGGGFSAPEFDPYSASAGAPVASAPKPGRAGAPAGIDPAAPNSGDEALERVSSVEQKLSDFIKSTTGTVYPTIKINGVFQADSAWVDQSAASTQAYGPIKDGVDFRRARLSASGAVTEVNNYMLQMDFAFFGRPTFTDLWVEQTDLPLLGTVRVGQWKQPFSLEVVSSFRYTTFAERSLVFQPFTPFRHIGIGFYNKNEALTRTWAGSLFAAGQDQFGGSIATNGGVATAGRTTWLPYYDEMSGGRHYLHLGAAHYFSAPNDHTVNFRTIPELYIGQFASAASGPGQQPTPTLTTGIPFFAATGNLAVQHYNVVGSEVLWVAGPWSLQSELMVNQVQRLGAASNLTFYGGYAQLGFFLTGEHRPYDRKVGAIDRVKPFENVFRVRSRDGGTCRGWGAWEVAARLSHIELGSDNVNGGRISDITGGLNWYLNPYTKAQFNLIHSLAESGVGSVTPGTQSTTNLYDLRLQVDF